MTYKPSVFIMAVLEETVLLHLWSSSAAYCYYSGEKRKTDRGRQSDGSRGSSCRKTMIQSISRKATRRRLRVIRRPAQSPEPKIPRSWFGKNSTGGERTAAPVNATRLWELPRQRRDELSMQPNTENHRYDDRQSRPARWYTARPESMGLRLSGKGPQSHRMVIFLAIFILMTLLFLYGSNNGNSSVVYTPFHVATNHGLKTTDLKKWAGKDGYVPFYGNKSMTLHCHSCALVTSSSHVLGSQAGEEIDRAECVIRMNDAPTLGYENDVGNRTSLRVVAHSSVFRVVRRPNEFLHRTDKNPVIIFWGPPNKIGKDAKGTLYRLIQRVSMTYSNLSCFSITPSKMHRFDSLFHKETGRDRQKSHSWLSTGWFTMVIAIEICDNIKVYGMVPPNHCIRKPGSKKMPYHYYKPRGPDECVTYLQNESGRRGNHHRFITEKQVFARWAKQYNITFTHPTW